MRLLVILALSALVVGQDKPALRIVVIAGEDAVNVVQQKTAVTPLVEVRDRNDLPVAGVPVTFAIAGNGAAVFAGGARTVTVTTNSAGQASASGLTPLASGKLQIDVTATHQGQTASTAINQTNAASAPQSANATKGAGGGASKALLTVGLITAAVGGGAAAVVGNSKDDGATGSSGTGSSSSTSSGTPTPTTTTTPAPPANQLPVVGTITTSPGATIVGLPITFSASASDPENDALTFLWDFGDGGGASTQRSPTYTYQRGGAFVARLTVADQGGSTRAEIPVSVKSLTGTWELLTSILGSGHLTITQHGSSSISGTQTLTYGIDVGRVGHQECPLTGTITVAAPPIQIVRPPCLLPVYGLAPSSTLFLTLSDDADTLTDLRFPPGQQVYTRR
jgi:hypothetical protein